jgi:hypothetical protein
VTGARACAGMRAASPIRRPLALIAVLALSAGVSSCGNGSHGPASAPPPPTAVTGTSPPPGGFRFFAPTSFWNSPLPADAPLDPQSPALVSALLSQVAAAESARIGPYLSTLQYSTPVYTVGPNQPRVRVHLDTPTPSNLQGAFNVVPLPPSARPAAGTDAHLTVWQPATDRLWEFWKLRHQTDGWHATWGGAMQDVTRSPGYFTSASWPGAAPYWGATATSLPLVGGLIRIDDLRQGRVDHGLALGLPQIRRGVFSSPAERTDGAVASSTAIPAGARFRLDPHLDVSRLGLPPFVRALAQAAQTHGIVVRDTAGAVTFYGEDPRPSDPNPYPAFIGPSYANGGLYALLARFPWNHLQLLRMDLHPAQS